MSAHSLSYVKNNNHKYGVIVISRDPKTSKVIGLQCCFCIAFDWEEKVGCKRKVTTKVQGWSTPFRYNNIENHMHTQHRTKWLEYDTIHSSSECDQFFTDVHVIFNNSIKAHFVFEFVGEQQIVFDIDKDIVETIVGDMMYRIEDEADSDNEDLEENPAFGNEAERISILVRRHVVSAKAKERTLLLFKRTERNKDGVLHSYTITIPKTKTKLFHLTIHYVLCETSFHMVATIRSCTYEVYPILLYVFALITT